MIIDAFAFARNAESASGEIALSALPRVDVLARDGALAWSLSGLIGSQSRPFLKLDVFGRVQLRCQRCLKPMEWPLALASTVWLAPSEAEADLLPVDVDEFDAVVGSDCFDVDALIEDEVLLAIPATPKHDVCPEPLRIEKDTAASPFAVLKDFKRDH
jgi:uncharacterized protein